MLTKEIKVQTMKCDYFSKKAVMARFRHSFGEGVGSVISMPGGYIRLPLGSSGTDAEKLRGDWETVGNEIRSAYHKVVKYHTDSSSHGKAGQREK